MADLQYNIYRDFGALKEQDLGGVRFFVKRFGELYHYSDGSENPHFLFACYAALPVVLTPDLLYQIWIRFQNEKDRFPYEVVSDLLLSGLCQEVRPQLFEMEASARNYFLKCLRRHPRFGPEREQQLARFLLAYASSHYPQKHQRNIRESQRFAAIAYLDAKRAAQEIIQSLNHSLSNRSEQRRLGSLIDALHIPLDDLPELIAYGRAIRSQVSGREKEAIRQIAEMPLSPDVLAEGEIDIAGTTLIVSPELRKLIKERIGELEALKKESQATKHYFSKIHLLCDASIDQLALAGQLFGVGLEADAPLHCYQYRIESKELKDVYRGVTFNIWHWSSDVPAVLDRFITTPGGYYLIAVSEGPKDEVKVKVRNLLNRINTQTGAPSNVGVLLIPDSTEIVEVSDSEVIYSEFKQVGLLTKLEEEHSLEDVLWQLMEASPEKGMLMPVTEIQPKSRLLRELVDHPFQKIAVENLTWNTALEKQLTDANIAGLLRYLPDIEAPLDAKIVTAPAVVLEKVLDVISRGRELQGRIPEETYREMQVEEDLITLMSWLGICWRRPEEGLSFYPFIAEKEEIDFTEKETTRLRYRFTYLPEDLWLRLMGALRLGTYTETRNIWSLHTVFIGLETDPKFSINNYPDIGLLEIVIAKSIQENFLYQSTSEVDEAIEGIRQTYPYSLQFQSQKLRIPAHATPDMVYVEGGTFTMGWLDEKRDGDGYGREKPAHEVKLNGFHICRYPVTFDQYDAFCQATGREKPKDRGWGRGNRPVIYADWYDAVEYCNWLSGIWELEKVYLIDKGKKDPNNKSDYDDKKWLVTMNENADGYRLPAEAEWEYAARGGLQSEGYQYAGSNDLDKVGWYGGNAGSKTHPVGEKNPNELGLHDMSGNVYEWCWDWFGENYYRSSPKENPRGPDSGVSRVIRGGGWDSTPRLCRVAYRNYWSPAGRNNYVGFRLARS